MFGRLKQKKSAENPALDLYRAAMSKSRHVEFYKNYGVPDSVDGRFDCLLLHIFLIINRIRDEEFGAELAQDIFDTCFADMDQTLREMGIGDMGVPKHMRRMMLAFNGRMHAYDQAMRNNRIEDALHRNLYGTCETVKRESVKFMADYLRVNIKTLKEQQTEDIMAGVVRFSEKILK